MEEWKIYKLGEITSKIGSGATPKGGRDSYLGGNISLIRSQNVLDFSFSKSGLAYINEMQAEKLNNVEVYEKDVLLNITGDSVARVCIVPNNVLPARVNQHVAIIRGNEKVDYRYLLYYLQYIKPQLLSLSQGGATRNALTKKMIEELEIKMPSKGTQKEIVSILYTLDTKIALNRRINDNLEQQAQAMFKSWFVENASYSGVSISEYFLPNRGKNLLVSDAKGGKTPVVAGGLTPSAFHNVANTKAPVITISASGANAGFVNLWGIPVWAADSSYIDSTIVSNIYFWYNLLKYNQKNIYESQTGSAQPHIYPKHIGNLLIPDLDMRKVECYESIVTSMYLQISEIQQETKLLTDLRDTLLPKLMSGELKINDLNC